MFLCWGERIVVGVDGWFDTINPVNAPVLLLPFYALDIKLLTAKSCWSLLEKRSQGGGHRNCFCCLLREKKWIISLIATFFSHSNFWSSQTHTQLFSEMSKNTLPLTPGVLGFPVVQDPPVTPQFTSIKLPGTGTPGLLISANGHSSWRSSCVCLQQGLGVAPGSRKNQTAVSQIWFASVLLPCRMS